MSEGCRGNPISGLCERDTLMLASLSLMSARTMLGNRWTASRVACGAISSLSKKISRGTFLDNWTAKFIRSGADHAFYRAAAFHPGF